MPAPVRPEEVAVGVTGGSEPPDTQLGFLHPPETGPSQGLLWPNPALLGLTGGLLSTAPSAGGLVGVRVGRPLWPGHITPPSDPSLP